MLLLPDGWKDYELLDLHKGEKLERWGGITVVRPDPQIIWPGDANSPLWYGCHMRYHRSGSGGGAWEKKRPAPERWRISWRELSFIIRPTGFKHMGLFPEQAANWDWLMSRAGPGVKVLNLFAYTGAASIACAKSGAAVTHVDAAKGMNQWARENAVINGVSNIRFLTDDVMGFVQRECRRRAEYDAIIMDPPSYGRGPGGEVWKIEDRLYELVKACAGLLSPNAKFFLINSYTTGFSPIAAHNILRKSAAGRFGGSIACGELGLRSAGGLILPCGIYARWERK